MQAIEPFTHTISLMSTLAIQGALQDMIIPGFESLTGVKVDLRLDPTNVLMQRIRDGERADLIVAVSADIDALVKESVLSEKGARALVSTSVGIAVHDEGIVFPLRSVDDLIVALVNARSVVYSRTGASGIYFAKLLERLGIATPVNDRATIIERGLAGEYVTSGRADVAIQQISELAIVPGLQIIGPLPDAVSYVTHFSIGKFSASDPLNNAVQQFLDFLLSASSIIAYQQYGLKVTV